MYFIFGIFLPKYLCVITTTTMKMIIIWITQYLSIKIILLKFYIWKITKTKFLSHMSKKGYHDYEYTPILEIGTCITYHN
jgi:hypothetical protein